MKMPIDECLQRNESMMLILMSTRGHPFIFCMNQQPWGGVSIISPLKEFVFCFSLWISGLDINAEFC